RSLPLSVGRNKPCGGPTLSSEVAPRSFSTDSAAAQMVDVRFTAPKPWPGRKRLLRLTHFDTLLFRHLHFSESVVKALLRHRAPTPRRLRGDPLAPGR